MYIKKIPIAALVASVVSRHIAFQLLTNCLIDVG